MTRLWGVQVGSDSHGHRYFRSRLKDSTGRESRWVLYAEEPEATTVPPEWFAWLHHMTDDVLTSRHAWQKPHEPNLTGTLAHHLPSGHDLCRLAGQKRAAATGDYLAWGPRETNERGMT